MRNLSVAPVNPGMYDGPRALFGGPLTGDALVRNIYSDEAGISANEPMSVVVALITHPDTQWRPISNEVRKIVDDAVPRLHRGGFAFHVKKLLKEKSYPGWGMSGRYALIRNMMEVPQRFNVPLSFGVVKRGTAIKAGLIEGLRSYEIDHVHAFVLAMSWADKYIRQYCGDDMAQIIAENHPSMQKFLRKQLNLVRNGHPLMLHTEKHRMHENASVSVVERNRVERLADEVHFMDREGSPFLQIADACAWGIRRYLSHRDEYGKAYLDLILGEGFVEALPGITLDSWDHFAHIRDFALKPSFSKATNVPKAIKETESLPPDKTGDSGA